MEILAVIYIWIGLVVVNNLVAEAKGVLVAWPTILSLIGLGPLVYLYLLALPKK